MDQPGLLVEAVQLGMFSTDVFLYRQGLVEEDISIGLRQLERIKAIAEERGYGDILAVLSEQFEYGHAFPDAPAETQRGG